MSNFELIDDYLTNRLSEGDKEGFEKQLESDAALKADVDFQRSIMEGIKSARAAQLKSMLNNVPVSTGYSVDFTLARMAASVIGAGIIGASIYFYLRPDDVPNIKDASADFTKKGQQVESKQDQVQPVTTPQPEEPQPDETPALAPTEKKKETRKQPKATSNASEVKPTLNVVNPTEELLEGENQPGVSENSKSPVSASHIEVETDTANKRYSFHYQFAAGKLFLYGSFDRNLYEILEIHSEAHTMFLFYKNNYYMLDEKQIKVTPLEAIRDTALIKKLKEYRGK